MFNYRKNQNNLVHKGNEKRNLSLLFFVLFIFLNPILLFAQTNSITLSVKNATLKQFFDAIEKQTTYSFSYRDIVVEGKGDISLDVSQQPIEQLLKKVLPLKGLQYNITGNAILITQIQKGKKHTVSGIVTNTKDEPIIGVNIVEKGTTNGTTTDLEGNFSIEIANTAYLQISSVGYFTQDFSTYGKTSLNVKMEEDTKVLDEVVVIGYGVIRKTDLTGSVSSIKSDEIKSIPTGTVLSALQGRSAGLQVKQNSGSPGGSISVRIRGTNSIQGSNEPLYVIDGFPSSSTNPTILDNADIESIEVLKDASAIAIYGSRGANGVVMITTKKGKAGKTKVDFETSFGTQTLRKKLEMMDAKEYATFYNTQRVNDGLKPYFSEPEINGFTDSFDWQKFVFKSAPIRTHSLSVSGGSDKTQFSVTANIFDQGGIVQGSSYNRYSIKANLNHIINNKFTISYGATLAKNKVDSKNWGGARFGASLISSALCAPPTLNPYNEDGSYRVLHSAYPFVSEGLANPLNYINEISDVTKSNKVLANLAVTYTPIKDLVIKIYGGIENSDDRSDYYKTLKYVNSQGDATVTTNQFTSILNENTVNYSKVFAKKHSFSALAGFTYQDFISTSLGGSGTGFLSDVTETGNLGSASIPGIPSSSYSKNVLLSYLGRINYSFDNRYLLTVSFRSDGSSKYSEGNKWGYFPSAAVAWKMKEEAFMKDIEWLSDLKVRASYGLTGSQAISAYATMNNLYSGKTVFGDALYTTFAPGTTLPGDLKWETTAQFDAGIDLGLLSNRITFTADYYIKNTSNLLNSVQLPSSLGYLNTIKNVGEIQNKGFEFTIDANVLTGPFSWKLSGNMSFNKSVVKKLYGGQDILGGWVDMMIISDNVNLLREGESMGAFYGYLKDGYDENGLEKYKDLNKDNVINQSDKTIIGDPNPNFIYGLNSFMSYKGFDLVLFFQGSQGNDIVNISAVDNSLDYGYGTNMLKDVVGNNWTPENTSAKYPKITRNQKMNFSDRLVEDGSYLRLRNIELAYNFPVSKWNQQWLQSLRLYASAQNLLTFTSYSGWDPEVNSQGGANSIGQGIDHYSYPTAKSFTFGIKVGF